MGFGGDRKKRVEIWDCDGGDDDDERVLKKEEEEEVELGRDWKCWWWKGREGVLLIEVEFDLLLWLWFRLFKWRSGNWEEEEKC